MNDLITIITPVYNASKYLDVTFKTVVAQTHNNWEWLLIDDKSTDNSWEIIQNFSQLDSRIKVFQNVVNSGVSVARNTGIENAKGTYLAFLDADDFWASEKLAEQIQFMRKHNLTMSCHSYKIVSEEGHVLSENKIPVVVGLNHISAYNPLATSFMMIQKDIVGSLRFDISMRRRQDWMFWYHLIKSGNISRNITESLGFYRKNSISSLSKNKFLMARIQWDLYRNYFRLGIVKSMLSFIKYAFYGIKKHYF